MIGDRTPRPATSGLRRRGAQGRSSRPPYRRAPRVGATQGGCPSTADDQEKGRASTPLHFQSIAHRGTCGKTRVVPHNRRPGPKSTEWGREMRVLLSTYDSRGGVEPLVALAVRLQALGAEVLVCAPPDCADRLAEVGVPLVPVGEPVRPMVHGERPPSVADVPRRITELIAAWFDKVAAAAEGCDALVATGLMPAAAGARSVAEKLGIHSVHVSYCPIFLPSPHHRPPPLPGQPLPPDVADNRVLWELNAKGYNSVFGPALNAHRVANG